MTMKKLWHMLPAIVLMMVVVGTTGMEQAKFKIGVDSAYAQGLINIAQKPAPPPKLPSITINIACAQPAGMILADSATKFKELIEARSGGRIRVNLFLGGAMGNEEEVMKAVTIGAIEGQTTGGIPINAYAPPFYFIDTPFVLRDWDHLLAIWNGPLGEKMHATMEAAGNTTIVGPIYRGLRHFTSKRPIAVPDDLKGIKLRLPVLPTWIAIWNEIGASTVPIPIGELYTALATGVADASEGDLTQIQGLKLNEVQTHLSLTGHLYSMGIFGFNTRWLRGLDAASRALIMTAANDSVAWASKTMMEKEEQVIRELAKGGMTVVKADRAAFAARGTPAMERLFRTHFRVTSLKEVMSYAK
jgi:tripartite ATP-independent transporter DctP family solute receptor